MGEAVYAILFNNPGRTGYGYFWYIHPDHYAAGGFGGQVIDVYPGKDIIIVSTAWRGNDDLTGLMARQYIIPSITGKELPANPEANKRMRELMEKAGIGVPLPVSAMPDTAGKISGKEYLIEENPDGLSSLKLTFTQENECVLRLDYKDRTKEIVVGLDNVFRKSKTGKFTFARGGWQSKNSFVIVDREDNGYTLIFNKDKVLISHQYNPIKMNDIIHFKGVLKK